MDRKVVKAGLRAYPTIDREVIWLDEMADEAEGEERKRYQRETADLKKAQAQIREGLNALHQTERECLWAHFIQGKTWARIHGEMHYSERQLRNLANRGADKLAKTLAKKPAAARFCEAAARGESH